MKTLVYVENIFNQQTTDLFNKPVLIKLKKLKEHLKEMESKIIM